jgi:disulfide bond formation protein DsbB
MFDLIDTVLARPRLIGLLLAAASAALLLGALYFQYVEGLRPCPLCIAQRWAHGASLAIGLLLALGVGGPRSARAWLGALGLAFLAGAGTATYHVGVEQKVIESAFCGVTGGGDTIEALKAELMATDVARCDEIPWSLLGISMAGYNYLISLVLAAVAFLGLGRRKARAGRNQSEPLGGSD